MYGINICKLMEAAVRNMPASKINIPLRSRILTIDLGRQMGHTHAAKLFHDNNSERFDTVIVHSLIHNSYEYNTTYKSTTLTNFINFFRGYRLLASDTHELIIIYDSCAPTKYDDIVFDLLSTIPNLRAIINLQ